MTAVDEYIAAQSPAIQEIFIKIRAIAKTHAPDAGEKISYGMPTFSGNGVLFHIAAQKKHLGFYPTPEGISAFADALSGYKASKGAVQFPYNKPIPYELIEKIIIHRIANDRKRKGKHHEP